MISTTRCCVFSILFLTVFCSLIAPAQDLTIREFSDTIIISAMRIPSPLNRVPMAVSSVDIDPVSPVFQNFSFNEHLQNVPGVFVMNSQNYAQDMRVSIRGFGSRASFGIRGIKLVVDGIPETTPDGQGQIDNLLVGSIKSMEIIRGPASSLYGNASGGVISISTFDGWRGPFAEINANIGAFGQYQVNGNVGFELGSSKFLLRGALLDSDGYRENSGVRNNILDLHAVHTFSDNLSLTILANYTGSPKADDPGGLNLDESNEDRTAARDRNVMFATGEEVNQGKVGAKLDWKLNSSSSFNSHVFYTGREFNGRLPFANGGIVDLSRDYFGMGFNFTKKKVGRNMVNTWMTGLDFLDQDDDRKRYVNDSGTTGDLVFDQIESFRNVGLYMLNKMEWKDWILSLGLRYDWNDLSARDAYLADGDDSGDLDLNNLNPSIGIRYAVSPLLSLFANFSTSFETPSLNELSSNPSGNAGFNQDLKSQEGKNFELGIRNQVADKIVFEAVVFHIRTNQEIIPYELELFPDREFFRNAGETTRSGFEFTSDMSLPSDWNLSGTYTFSNIEYSEYIVDNDNLMGNKLPGIPRHMGDITLRRTPKNGWVIYGQARFIGDLFANDENTTSIPGYVLVNVKAGVPLTLNKARIFPYVGINNLFNTKFFDNIRINAFGGRYYEPAPEINLYAGIRISFVDH